VTPLDASETLETPLLWAGGKRWLIPRLLKMWRPHAHRRLVEPFCGAMSVVLGLRPERALLNDANAHLMRFWDWVQQPGPGGAKPKMRFDNDERRYYACRKRFNALAAGAVPKRFGEAAELFYYLNRSCFNGLCRFNSDDGFNVPYGRRKSIRYMRDFSPWSSVLAKWELRRGNFSSIVLQPDDCVYADPPYDVPFTAYSAGGFTWTDQEILARWLTRHPGPVIASNQATRRVLKLYRSLGFKVKTLMGPRRISCDGDRTPAREMLATRNI